MKQAAKTQQANRHSLTLAPETMITGDRSLTLGGTPIIGCLLAIAMLVVSLPGFANATASAARLPAWPVRTGQDDALQDDALQDEVQQAAEAESDSSFSDEEIEFFENQVQPILKEHCFKCHGGEKLSGGLNLTFRQGLIEGGDSGPAIDLEEPAYSLLLEAVRYESYEMPPSGQLPQEQIDILSQWVGKKSPWTPGSKPLANHSEHKAEMAPAVNEETKSFWSFQPVQRPELPVVQQPIHGEVDWTDNPIDRFVLARLESEGLNPNPPADRSHLVRRVYYDLIGLPPTPEEVQAFLHDDSSDAYEKLVDQLLQSPHYGEKWGRHWLDLVRYAETNSYERDGAKPFVWRYRDYVIRSFNEDKPYDQFIREQIAGDELEEVTPESIIATGYYRLGRWDDEPADPKQAYYDDLDDIVMTTSQTFLGLTLNCARCHDHKIDPVPQSDYYRMLAFFDNIERYGVRSEDTVYKASVTELATPDEKAAHEEELKRHREDLAHVEQRLAELETRVKADFEPVEHEEFKHEMNRVPLMKKRVPKILSEEEFADYQRLFERRKQLRNSPPPALAQALCVKEKGSEAPETYILIRGSAHAPGDRVEPGFPTVLSPPEPKIEPSPETNTTGRRRALADWLTSAENPLVSRVMVNRLWQHHFGRGIVESSNDFGFQGTPPTHPDLLDWLAAELVAQNWSLKALHKQILMSNTYRQSSADREDAMAKDPTNRLFWRYGMRRLTAEEIRDSVLAVNGSINLKDMYGPSIYTRIPQEVLAGQSRPGSGWGNSSEEEQDRRSIYIHVKRSLVEPTLEVFDFADTDATCPVRFATTQPTQALAMMNSDFINAEAKQLAEFAIKECGSDVEARVDFVLWRVLQREPSPNDVELGIAMIEKLQESESLSLEESFEYFCLMCLNLNEFLYVD